MNPKPETTSLIVNPRAVPSMSWADAQQMPLSAWSAADWAGLGIEQIQSALREPTDVADLWPHDVSHTQVRQNAAVLILLIATDSGFDVVMTTRAAHLRHHPGQVSFAGGRIEAGETAEQAALREAAEEISLSDEQVRILGRLPVYHTITGFAVTPVVAWMTQFDWQQQNLQLDRQEVDECFVVPLMTVWDRQKIRVHHFAYGGQERQFLSVLHTDNEREYFIWGASMAMLHNFDLLVRAQLQM